MSILSRSPKLMTQDSIRHSDLSGRLVLNQTTAEDIGQVAELWFDAKTHQIAGFTCRSGLLKRQQQFIPWTQVETIGEDSVLVNLSDGAEPNRPEQTITLVKQEIWTDDGNKAGMLVDYHLNLERGEILDYLFTSNGWRGVVDGLYRLHPEHIISMNDQRLIAQKAAVQEAELVEEGLSQRANQFAAFLKEDYDKTRDDLASMLKGTKAIASQVQQTTQNLTGREPQALPEGTEDHHDDSSTSDPSTSDPSSSDKSE